MPKHLTHTHAGRHVYVLGDVGAEQLAHVLVLDGGRFENLRRGNIRVIPCNGGRSFA